MTWDHKGKAKIFDEFKNKSLYDDMIHSIFQVNCIHAAINDCAEKYFKLKKIVTTSKYKICYSSERCSRVGWVDFSNMHIH